MTATYPLAELRDELGGHIVHVDHGAALALPDGGVIYHSPFGGGFVKIMRYGHPVVTLGQMSDGVDAIVAAYRELTAVRSA